MKTDVLKISLREQAIYVPIQKKTSEFVTLSESTMNFAMNLAGLGFGCSEPLLQAVNQLDESGLKQIFETLKDTSGLNKSWLPMTKDWLNRNSANNHKLNFFDRFKGYKGLAMPCGCNVPNNVFQLKSYNGCPVCGKAFGASNHVFMHQGSKLKELKLWRDTDVADYLKALLNASVALDATQRDSLTVLLKYFDVPTDVKIQIKENAMLVIDALTATNKEQEAATYFSTPNDVIRYLWFKHTGFIQVFTPKTILKRKAVNANHIYAPASRGMSTYFKEKANLKLKYSRSDGRRVAAWLNNMKMPAAQMCEIMHPRREMWVRFIRALRLAEHAKRKGFGHLAEVLDRFYRKDYEVWAGKLENSRMRYDEATNFNLLKQRPGLFARSLFANILWFGTETTLYHFTEIVDKVPARLLITLNMYAKVYFSHNATRVIKPNGGTSKRIGGNQFIAAYTEKQLIAIQQNIEDFCIEVLSERFARKDNTGTAVFIDKGLFNIPVAIGDRSDSVQDLPSALMGTKFPLESNQVRLFMQWGKGLRAQHLDMDLSCKVAYNDHQEFCSYSSLEIAGCKHSGDIIEIPHMSGTAEYIELDVAALKANGAQYVSFTCNAYSNGSIAPNLEVGWMNSRYPMKISRSGVAYDPSCVQHKVRITQGLNKGLLFGILDVQKKEITWMEMSFGGQIVQNLNVATVKGLLTKLDSKMSLGNLLTLKAGVQNMNIVSTSQEADVCYDKEWASNSTAINELLQELDAENA